MTNQKEYLWDGEGEEAGDAFDRKYEECEQRNWMTWLAENLVFPFKVIRQEDMDDTDFHKAPAGSSFQVGHTMEIVGLDGKDEMMGIIVEAKEKWQIGHLPLADLEVKPKTDKNYWPVREYVVWFANR